jgi:hypothetical protein
VAGDEREPSHGEERSPLLYWSVLALSEVLLPLLVPFQMHPSVRGILLRRPINIDGQAVVGRHRGGLGLRDRTSVESQ